MFRAVFQQHLDHGLETLERGAGDRRLAAVVAQVGIGLVFEEDAHGVGVAVIAREHHEGVAVVVAQVRRQALVQQGVEHGRVAAPGDVEDFARERDHVFVGAFVPCVVGFLHMLRSFSAAW